MAWRGKGGGAMSYRLQTSRGRWTVMGFLLVGFLVLTACASGSTSGNGGPTATVGAPTATTPPKPLSSHPNITVAYCPQLLALNMANQNIPSSSPATTLTPGHPNDPERDACHYVQ